MTEETLRDQMALLIGAQRIGRMGSWSLDLRSGHLLWSETTCDLFGITPAEFAENFGHFYSFILVEDLPGYIAAHDRASVSEPLLEVEYRIRRPDGAVRWMYERGTLEFDGDGLPMSGMGMVMDITEQKVAREQLVQNATLLRIAGRAARLGGWTYEIPDGTLTWSDENCAIHDVPPGYLPTLEESIGFYLPEHREQVSRYLWECGEKGTPYDFELPIITAKNRRIWVRSIGEAVRDVEGRVVRLQGASQDVSAQKQAEARLREQASLIDQANDAIVVRDLDDRITFWSKGAERLYGWFANEALGRRFDELLRVDERLSEAAKKSTLADGGRSVEIEKTTAAGKVVIVDSSWTLLLDDHGLPKSILSIDTNITERRSIEKQFFRSQRLESLGTLASGIAHDLNNLLLPVIMGVTLLKLLEPNQQSLRAINNIESSARRGTDLVKQILLFARGSEGSREPVDMAGIVREVGAIVESTFPKNIVLATAISGPLSKVLGDVTQLNQVLLNLCVNARDAMPEGGHIRVSAADTEIDETFALTRGGTAAGRYVVINVADDGSGMSKEVIDRIFEPFFTTKDLTKGTGLGLATVQGIVRSHGGFIDVLSEVGRGSTFRAYLPAAVGGAVRIVDSEAESLPLGNGELILVVDDEESIRDMTRQTLESFGYRVLTAGDGAHAISLYTREHAGIAVVLTDMMMPVMDGAALIAALRRMDPNVPILAVSGHIETGQTQGIMTSGATRFLSKPYSAEVLLRVLSEMIEVSRA